MTLSYGGLDLETSPYGIVARGDRDWAPRGDLVTPLLVRAGAIVTPIAPGQRSLQYTIGVEGNTAAEHQDNLDALKRVLGRRRQRLVSSLNGDGRFIIASARTLAYRPFGPLYCEVDVEFVAEAATFSAALPSGDVQTPTLTLLPGYTTRYGATYTLTPGGSAPVEPRVLVLARAGSVTPILIELRNLTTGRGVVLSSPPAAGGIVLIDPAAGVFQSAPAALVGFWPLADASGPLLDFSGNSRDLARANASLTLSGNELTDTTRSTNTEGDGFASPDSSMGIWEGTTNLTNNGGLETNATNWSAGSRSTAQSKFGTASLTLTMGAFSQVNHTGLTLANNTQYTLSVWIRSSLAQNFRLGFVRNDFGAVVESGALSVGSANTWTRLTFTGTIPATGTWDRIAITELSGNTPTVYIDGVQVEATPIATPYKHTDGGTAARSAARVQGPAALVDETVGAVAFRVAPGWANTARSGANPVLWQWRDDASNVLELRYDGANARWEFQRRNSGGTAEVTVADTFTADEDITVIATWDASNLKLSINGAAFTTQAGANIPTLAATQFDIGSSAGASEHFDGRVRWAVFYTSLLTDGNASTLHGFGNTDPAFGSLPGSPTALWNGVGSTLTTS